MRDKLKNNLYIAHFYKMKNVSRLFTIDIPGGNLIPIQGKRSRKITLQLHVKTELLYTRLVLGAFRFDAKCIIV